MSFTARHLTPAAGKPVEAGLAAAPATDENARIAQPEPEALFRTIPGVGVELSRRLHDELDVDTLESLELAAHDGQLQRLPRIGARRAAAIRAALTQLLDRTRVLRRRYPVATSAHEPEVQVLLDIDRQYRRDDAAGALPTLAPRRFNPGAKAWLPVLHTTRGDWHCTGAVLQHRACA